MAIHTAYSVRVNSTYAASTRSRAVLPASELKARSRRRPDLSPTSFLPAAGWINRSSACRHGHARVLPARPPGCHHHLPIHAVRCDLPLRFRHCGGSTWSSCCPARRSRTHDQGRGRAGTGMAIPSPPGQAVQAADGVSQANPMWPVTGSPPSPRRNYSRTGIPAGGSRQADPERAPACPSHSVSALQNERSRAKVPAGSPGNGKPPDRDRGQGLRAFGSDATTRS